MAQQPPPDRMVHAEASWRVERLPQHMHCVCRSWDALCLQSVATQLHARRLQLAYAGLWRRLSPGCGWRAQVLVQLPIVQGLPIFPHSLRYSVLRAAPSCHPNDLFYLAHISFGDVQHAGSHRSSLRAASGHSAMQRGGTAGPRAGRQCGSCSTLLLVQWACRIDQNAPARQRLLPSPPHRPPPPVCLAAAGPIRCCCCHRCRCAPQRTRSRYLAATALGRRSWPPACRC